MVVSSNLQTFLGKPVVNYVPGTALDPNKYAYRLRVEYDDEDTPDVTAVLDALIQDPKAGSLTELIIGMYTSDYGESLDSTIKKLAELKTVFTNLKALFIGDITYEECEISWIKQGDIAPVLQAYPNLEYLQIRGGDGLSFSNLQHDKLTTLIIESGGLPPNVVYEVNNARLPNLQRLDLWLGSDNYGFDSTVEDFANILSGKQFPQLTHLGLMDSEIQDEIAIAVSNAPVLQQLKVLDLSMGTLTDRGGTVLFNSPGVRKLQHLNLRHHYLTDSVMEQLRSLGISINLDDQEGDEEDRYAEVTE